jgi:hypothetical protein
MLTARLYSTLAQHAYRTDTTIFFGFVEPRFPLYLLTSQRFVINNLSALLNRF